MKGIIDNITDWLVSLKQRRDHIELSINAFGKRGNNTRTVGFIFFGMFMAYFSFDLYEAYGILWLALLPICFFIISIFIVIITHSYRDKLRLQNQSSRLRLVGLNLDFNQRILEKIYRSLTKYGYLDEDLTSFPDFYNVLLLDFDEHDSALHFNCTQPQLKYILEKFKQYKKGIRLKTFERSQKVYHKGNLISSEVLSKKYHESPPDQKFEQQIDSFFDFLGDI